MAKIHISCPLSVSESYLKSIAAMLVGMGHTINYWDRNAPTRYNETWIAVADAVVFILPSNSWSLRHSELPQGLQKEHTMCKFLKKKTFLAYRTLSGDVNIYETNDTFDGIYGVISTYSTIKSFKMAAEACHGSSVQAESKRYAIPKELVCNPRRGAEMVSVTINSNGDRKVSVVSFDKRILLLMR